MYSIIRKRKHKSIGSLTSREKHTYRTQETPNADPAKLHKNKLLFGSLDYAKGVESELKKYSAEGKNIRKNAVVAVEYLLTASPEFLTKVQKMIATND